MSDINQLIIEKSIEHWPVFGGVGFMLFWTWRWIIPSSVKKSLENGGGDAVRAVVAAELHKQDERIEQKLQKQDERFEEKLTRQMVFFDTKLQQNDQKQSSHLIETMKQHEDVERFSLENVILKVKNDISSDLFRNEETHVEIRDRLVEIEKKLKVKKPKKAKSKRSPAYKK